MLNIVNLEENIRKFENAVESGEVRNDRLNDSKLFIELKRFELLISMYSSGYSINLCKEVYIKMLNGLNECYDGNGESYVDLLWYVSLGVLFEIGLQEINILDEMVSRRYYDDKLICFFMRYLKGSYQDGKSYFMSNPYSYLDILISGNCDDVSSFIIDYLSNKWYKAHKGLYWYDSHKYHKDSYFGYWSFEIGAIVKIMGIDDYNFRDLKYYPYGLVHYFK